jgi:hypothetical protein
MNVLGYKYTNEEDAIAAVELCNFYYNIPSSVNALTQNWVNYELASLNNPVFYYIKYNDSLNVVLGEPIIFEITINTII